MRLQEASHWSKTVAATCFIFPDIHTYWRPVQLEEGGEGGEKSAPAFGIMVVRMKEAVQPGFFFV